MRLLDTMQLLWKIMKEQKIKPGQYRSATLWTMCKLLLFKSLLSLLNKLFKALKRNCLHYNLQHFFSHGIASRNSSLLLHSFCQWHSVVYESL